MTASLKHWVIIPAAGTSQRMNGTLPKQYLPIQDATVIEYAIKNFLQHAGINGVIVALHEDDQHWQSIRCRFRNEKIHTVTRWQN